MNKFNVISSFYNSDSMKTEMRFQFTFPPMVFIYLYLVLLYDFLVEIYVTTIRRSKYKKTFRCLIKPIAYR